MLSIHLSLHVPVVHLPGAQRGALLAAAHAGPGQEGGDGPHCDALRHGSYHCHCCEEQTGTSFATRYTKLHYLK